MLVRSGPGGRFSKDPVTYRARKVILKTKKFQSTNSVPIEDTMRFLSPEKFRDFRETDPWNALSLQWVKI